MYISTRDNPAGLPSRRLSTINSCLTNSMWQVVQLEFGGPYKFCVILAITTTVISFLLTVSDSQNALIYKADYKMLH